MPESVWDYPRPPRVEPLRQAARVIIEGIVIANSARALRVLETSHPPAIYFPPDDVLTQHLKINLRATVCEFKGTATYVDAIVGDRRVTNAGWTYPDPNPEYARLRNYISFYPGLADECYIGDERVTPQEGDFYGGWLTADITGPFKGGPGTAGW